MTTPAEPPGGDSASDTSDAPDAPDPAASAGSAAPRRFRWLRVVAACTALFVLALAGGVWYFYQRLDGNITTDTVTENQLMIHASERPTEGPTKAENILLIGSDNRGDGNEKYGEDSGTQRSDTTILLHLSADRSSATAVSIPRDLMAHVPDCTRPDGSTRPGRFEQFNWAFEGAERPARSVPSRT